MVSNLALFCLATYLAAFSKIGQFFPNHLVTLARADLRKFCENKSRFLFTFTLCVVSSYMR